jgi:two-component system, LytTR family, sensor histidine kinase AlgZ
MKHRVRFWAGIVAVCAAASVLAQVAFGGVSWQTPWLRVVSQSFSSFLFSFCCSAMCIVALPRLAPKILRGFAAPFSWAIITGLLAVLAAAGSLIAMLIFSMMGLVPARAILHVWMGEPLKISVISTLLFGMFFTVVGQLRARLDAAKLALRTKERDEAEARRLAAEAQLASIESRVQPHFLFNTLNSIAALVHDDPAGAERMTTQLASLMRSSLDSTSKPLVPLEEELRVIAAYLSIEGVRFGNRLRYTIDVPDAARTVQVPRLAVQTIVENSVKYAVSPRREGGSIAIRGTTSGGRVEIAVEDDGPGFDASAMPPGHGLSLVRERLARTLGAEASLAIDGRPGRTAVTLSVPANAVPLPSNAQPVTSNVEAETTSRHDSRICPGR